MVELKGSILSTRMVIFVQMNNLSALIQHELSRLHWTNRQLAEYSGVSHTYVGKLIKGEMAQPSVPVLKKLADALGTPAEVFLVAAGYVEETSVAPKTVRIPLIGEIRAGPPMLAVQEQDGDMEITEELARKGVNMALRVRGESMVMAGIPPNAVVLIKQTNVVESGSLAAVMVNDEACIKRVYLHNGSVTLHSESAYPKRYPDMVYPANEVSIIGEVIEARNTFR